MEHLELSFWISPTIISHIKTYSNTYSNNSPFPHISLSNFLLKHRAQEIKTALENIEFQEYDTDLYHFFKSKDFKHIKHLPSILQQFHEFIFSKTATTFFMQLTNETLQHKVGDLHSILLEHTHYLLCHDDKVDSRKIAFILNLSEHFTSKTGGNLQLYSSNSNKEPTTIKTSILPKFNQLNIFTVSDTSFHDISEIVEENKSRISISGWYYN